MNLFFVIKTTPKTKTPSLNDLIRAERTIFKKGNKIISQGALMKKKWQSYFASQIVSCIGRKKVEKPFTVHYDIYEPDLKRDIGNVFSPIEKYTMDALQDTGTIPNDNQKWYKGFSADFYVDREHPRIEVTIKEIE